MQRTMPLAAKPPPQRTRFYGWTVAATLWLTLLITTGLPYYGASVVIANMAKSIAIDKATIGIAFSLLTVVWGLSGPFTAALLNRKGLRFTVVLGTLVIAVGCALIALLVQNAWTFVVLFGLVIGAGIGLASNLPAQTGVALWFTRKRPLVISLVMTASGVGGFLSPMLLQRIMHTTDNWRMGWAFAAAACALCALVAAIFLRDRPADLGQSPDGLEPAAAANNNASASAAANTPQWTIHAALRTAVFWQILIAAIVFSAPIPMLVAHGVVHFESLGHSASEAAWAIGLMVLLSVPGKVLGGALCQRMPARWVWCVMMLLTMAGLLVGVTATTTPQILLFAALIGIGFGACIICWASSVASTFGGNSFATVMGAMAPVSMLFTAVVPTLSGMLYDRVGSYTVALWGCSAALLIGMLILGMARSAPVTYQGA